MPESTLILKAQFTCTVNLLMEVHIIILILSPVYSG